MKKKIVFGVLFFCVIIAIIAVYFKLSEIQISNMTISKIEIIGVTEKRVTITDSATIDKIKELLVENRGRRTLSINTVDGWTYEMNIYSDGKKINCTIAGGKLFIGDLAYYISDEQISNISNFINPMFEE